VIIRKISLILSLIVICLTLSAQDISGIWQGILRDSNPKGVFNYTYTMTIVQNGQNIIATSHAIAVGTPYSCDFGSRGVVINNVLMFEDTSFAVSEPPVGLLWCAKFGNLIFTPSLEKLSGTLPPLGPDYCHYKVELYRLLLTADTVHCSAKIVLITARGQNVKWYADKDKSIPLGSGNSFSPFVNKTTTYYATQTTQGFESIAIPITIHITTSSIFQQTKTICEGQSLTVGDTTYRTTGIYSRIIKKIEGCDSIVNTNLTVINSIKRTRTLTICEGQSVTVGDTIYKTSGTYSKRFINTTGCDSIVTTILIVKSTIKKSQTLNICTGQSIMVGDTTYKTSGIYIKKMLTTEGCDSIVTTNLTISNPIQKTQTLNICQGESISVGDTTYRTTGNFVKKLISITGCDSIITTNLTVNGSIQKTQTLFLCEGQSIRVGDTTYKTSGNYIKKLQSSTGCDSIVTTQLTVSKTIEKKQVLSICEGQSVAVGDTLYKTSGIYIKHIKLQGGCDSIVTTQLEVKKMNIILSRDTLVRLGDSIQINAQTNWTTPISWKWSPPIGITCDTCQNTWIKPTRTLAYTLEAKDKTCRATKDIIIRVKNGCNVYIPTAFSPNGDSNNDNFTIHWDNCLKSIKRFAVFNRLGNLIISQNDLSINNISEKVVWDGTISEHPASVDVYVYFFEVEYVDGTVEILKGDVSVMR
jgi:gliding motility-associated-like protein